MISLSQQVDNPAAIIDGFGGGAVIRWERSDTGTDDVDFTEFDTTPLSATTTYYTTSDPFGSTSTWYRTRFSKTSPSVASDYSDWSDPWQVALSTYATFDDFTERLEMPDTSRYNTLQDLLSASARYLDSRIGFDFLRHGTETRVFDVEDSGRARIAIYGGIVSASSVSYATSTGDTLTALDGADWYLYPRQLEPEGTYTHVALSSVGTLPRTYRGQGIVSITGVFGWSTPPTVIREANIVHAARSYNEWKSKYAGIQGNPEFGTIPLAPNLPDVVYRAIETYRRYWWLAV